MSPRRALPLAMVLVLVAVLGTGCYTVLRHPEAEPYSPASPYSSGQGLWDRDYYGTDPGFLYRWTDPYYTSLYGDFPPAWGYYYYHPWTPTGPWWYDPWVPWHPWDPGDGSPAPITGGRHAWDRGPGAPSPGPNVPGVGGTAPSPGGVAPHPATPAAPAPPPADTTRPPEKRPDPAKDDNPHRNAWGR